MFSAPIKQQYVQPTSKGQVTLPVSVRRALAIDPNTILNVTVERGRVVLEPVIHSSATTERWEPVIDFTQFSPNGVLLSDLQRSLKQWTRSKKRSRN
jgi:AbrB family looped-hinge helix DNA binding protein